MSRVQQNLQSILKGKKAQFEEKAQTSEPQTDMAGMLELLDQDFKTVI